MKNNFKTILKKIFKFDEEKLEDQGTFGYGEDVMQELDKEGIAFLPSWGDTYKDSKIPAKNIRLVHILLANDGDGNQYLLFLRFICDNISTVPNIY